jgi:hypothetical protein
MTNKWTYTHYSNWTSSNSVPVPTDPKKHIVYLERAVYELIEWLVDELGHDNINGVIDSLSDQLIETAHRAHKRSITTQ